MIKMHSEQIRKTRSN